MRLARPWPANVCIRSLQVPATSGRLRARLHELGMVASEEADESGWRIEIDAPRSLIEPLFGMPGGHGALVERRLACPD